MKHVEQFVLICAVLMSAFAFAASAPTMTWQEALKQVGPASKDSATLKSTMAKLSDADQLAFLDAVNKAIANQPGSAEAKSAAFVVSSKAALSSASRANKTAMLAEIYATVPPAYLTDVNENFAKVEVNRGSASDEEFANRARGTTTRIAARNATADNSSIRTTFAILMFLRASNGTPTNLVNELVAKLPPASQSVAATSWIPSAMKDGDPHRYDPMLGAANAGEEPNHVVVGNMLVSWPSIQDALLGDLQAESSEGMQVPADNLGGGYFANPGSNPAETSVLFGDNGISRVPRSVIDGNVKRGSGAGSVEPHGYNGQN